jgi:hypothetical protein
VLSRPSRIGTAKQDETLFRPTINFGIDRYIPVARMLLSPGDHIAYIGNAAQPMRLLRPERPEWRLRIVPLRPEHDLIRGFINNPSRFELDWELDIHIPTFAGKQPEPADSRERAALPWASVRE